jgi:hypothetical protein
MRPNFKISSIFLLIIFGINLVSEIAPSHSGTNDSHILETYSSSLSDDISNISTQSNDLEKEHNDCCNDPCHLGICHLGHCGKVTQFDSEKVLFSSSKINKDPINFNFLNSDTPYLEGLRRPPKIS